MGDLGLNHKCLVRKMCVNIRLDKCCCKNVNSTELFINCRPAAKISKKIIFEELQRIPRSRDFRDAIEALKHVVNKQQTSRFGVIIL